MNTDSSTRPDVVVVGAGIAGLTTAYELTRAGVVVSIVDPSPAQGASYAAAGMLAPASEVNYGEEVMSHLLIDASRYWTTFAQLLESAGAVVGFEPRGTLLVAYLPGDRKELRRLMQYQHSLGIRSTELSREEALDLEPLLSPRINGALHTPDDHQVDNRALNRELLRLLLDSGVEVVRAQVVSISGSPSPSVVLSDGTSMSCSRVVVATGVASANDMLPSDVSKELVRVAALIRSIRGDILRLNCPKPALSPTRCLRAQVANRWVYLLPRAGGEVVVGATADERSGPDVPRAGSVLSLLDDAATVLPAVREMDFVEAASRCRPGSIDNYPIVGATIDPTIYLHNGLFRHGYLLAPFTSKVLVEELLGGEGQASSPASSFRTLLAPTRERQSTSHPHQPLLGGASVA